jgi:BolA family transcriptional regulator, general stress-responsive regulator
VPAINPTIKPTIADLRIRFEQQFPTAQIEIEDESHLHAGHAGAEGGAGHFSVKIVSSQFAALNTVARHRLVYDAVRDWMPNRVHALRIQAVEPSSL